MGIGSEERDAPDCRWVQPRRVLRRYREIANAYFKQAGGGFTSYGSNGAEAMEAPLYEMACEIIGMHAPRYRFFNLLEI
jgi:hypothetical protein